MRVLDIPFSAVGDRGAQRNAHRDMWEADLLGRFAGLPTSGLSDNSMTPAEANNAADLRRGAVVAFVARRIYRHLRLSRSCSHRPRTLNVFDEQCFDGVAVTPRRPSHLLFSMCPCIQLVCSEPRIRAADVFEFIHDFVSWFGLPTDLVVVALVYLDKLLRKTECACVMFTSRSWRSIVSVCLMMSSKMWEDYCICSYEVAQFAGFNYSRLLQWELAAMDLLGWDANIPADVFAPYFWAVKQALDEGRDVQEGSITGPLSKHARANLERGLAVQLASDSMIDFSSEDTVGPWWRSLDEMRQLVGNLPEPTCNSFVFVSKLEDRYRLLKSIGRGSFGEVKLVARLEDVSGQPVHAVKLFAHAPKTWLRTFRSLTESFVLSGISGSLRHPNIVRFIEFLVDEHKFVLGREQSIVPIMEALVGPDLFDWLDSRHALMTSSESAWISRWEVLKIISQVASGIAYIHGHKPFLVHRDVKPENLRWASPGSRSEVPHSLPDSDLKLVDFGTVYIEGCQDAMENQIVGTSLYRAPEAQAWPLPLPAPSLDVFSLGMIMFLLCCGRFACEEESGVMANSEVRAMLLQVVPLNIADLASSLVHTEVCKRPSSARLLEHDCFQEFNSERGPNFPGVLPAPTAPIESLRMLSALSQRNPSVI